jgi:urease accessory protein
VGLWAVQLGGSRRWIVPAGFLAAMGAGAALGFEGIGIAGVETGIALSVLICGLLIALAVKVPAMYAAGLVGLFALLHGNAHAVEMVSSISKVEYVSGLFASTGALHLAGLFAGALMMQAPRSQIALRFAGLAIALSAAAIIF